MVEIIPSVIQAFQRGFGGYITGLGSFPFKDTIVKRLFLKYCVLPNCVIRLRIPLN